MHVQTDQLERERGAKARRDALDQTLAPPDRPRTDWRPGLLVLLLNSSHIG